MKLENITKRFGEKTVFENLTLEIKEGKFTSLTGASGCGKTTLLRIIAGLDNDYSGSVSGRLGVISFAFQEHRLFEGATVIENTALSKDKRSVAEEILTDMGIGEENFSLYPSSLSGGMARRVSIARSIVYDADLYLIDEPFSGLDADSKEKCAKSILERLKGKTVVISTHDTDFANQLDCHIYL